MDEIKRKKFNIPAEHLSFEYINICNKKKELEQIVGILRSGDEGYYPDLLKCAEARLLHIAPQSSLLRKSDPLLGKHQIKPEHLEEIENELKEWEKDIKFADESLKRGPYVPDLPPVRSAAKNCVKVGDPGGNKKDSDSKQCRIKRDDYKSWDKFDVDDALLKMDVEEERAAEEAMKYRLQCEKREKEFINQTMTTKSSAPVTNEEESKILSEKAREKGNEYFKEGDWARADACYTESHSLFPNCPACNNRAMTLIKLGKYEAAVNDCNYVLQREPNNVKALLRRASALKSLPNQNLWKEALTDLETVISMEPNNKIAQNDYHYLRKKFNLPDASPKVRLKIEESYTGPLPVTYYGPSTSSFRCERNSLTHQLLAGPRMGPEVPCRCNRGAMKQNPICWYCGEMELRQLKAKSRVRRTPIDPSLCAASVAKEGEIRSNKVLPNKRNINMTIPNGEQIMLKEGGSSTIINKTEDAPTTSVVLGADKTTGSNVGNEFPTVKLKPENDPNSEKLSRMQHLALEAQQRGNDSLTANDLERALAYFSTSLNLHPSSQTFFSRAETYQQMNKHSEAIKDYNKVLEEEPDNVSALVGRISASFKNVPRDLKTIVEYVQKAHAIKPDDDKIKEFRMQVNKLLKTAEGKTNVKINNRDNRKAEQDHHNASPNSVFIGQKIGKNHSVAHENCCPHPTPEGKKRERNHRNKKNKKRGASATGKSSQDNVEAVADSVKKLNLTNNIEITEKNVEPNLINYKTIINEALQSGFQFYSSWESCKKQDLDYKERVQLLRKIPPSRLVKVIGEKLDAEMLNDMLQCLELMSEDEGEKVAEYLNVFPDLQRFQTIRLFMDSNDLQRMNTIITSLEDKGIKVSANIKANNIF